MITITVIASGARRSRKMLKFKDFYWIATSPTAPRNDNEGPSSQCDEEELSSYFSGYKSIVATGDTPRTSFAAACTWAKVTD